MTATRRRPTASTYDVTASSRMIGSWLRASSAAFRPSSTSCEGLYLLLGGVIRVCAEAIDPMSARESVVAQNRLFIFLTLCKSGTDRADGANNCQPGLPSDANCQLLTCVL